MITNLSEYLAEIGSLLGSKAEHREYNIFGIPTRKIDYEDDTSNKVGRIN